MMVTSSLYNPDSTLSTSPWELPPLPTKFMQCSEQSSTLRSPSVLTLSRRISIRPLLHLFSDIPHVVFDAIALGRNLLRSRRALAAENLFLWKQLTFFVERERPPRRTDNATRFKMVTLSRLFNWKDVLVW